MFTRRVAKALTDETSRQLKGGVRVPEDADFSWFSSTADIDLLWQGGTWGKETYVKCRWEGAVVL